MNKWTFRKWIEEVCSVLVLTYPPLLFLWKMDIKELKGAKITHAGLLQHNNDGSTETQKITHAGLLARSPEGTAAKGMNIRGNEDLWVEIQANTFRNWVNEHLRGTGMQVSYWSKSSFYISIVDKKSISLVRQ